jgi:hypothetical protein
MDICVDSSDINNIDYITFQKMKFLYNALENGWSIIKKEDKYIFNKKHEGEKEIYLDSYLKNFIINNIK